jgi:S1-C subfamily serine protease
MNKLLILFLLLTFTSPLIADSYTVENLYESVVKIEVESTNIFGESREFSGIIIDSSGLILTVGIYTKIAETINVTFNNGSKSSAKVIGCDSTTDLCLLRPTKSFTTKGLSIYDGRLELEQEMVVLPFNKQKPVKVEIVKSQDYTTSTEYKIDSALFTIPITMEYLGAPLITSSGKLAGIGRLLTPDVDILPKRRVPGNIFIPVKALTDNLGKLLQGPVKKAWYGFSLKENNDKSLKVLEVLDDSPAKEAGLLAGDTIVALDSKKIAGLSQFYTKIWETKKPINLSVLRKNTFMSVIVVGKKV